MEQLQQLHQLTNNNMERPDLEALEMEVESMTPKFHLSEEMLKSVKTWKTGSKYKVELEVKMVGKEEELGSPVEARFEILKAKEVSSESKPDDRLLQEGENVQFIDKVIN